MISTSIHDTALVRVFEGVEGHAREGQHLANHLELESAFSVTVGACLAVSSGRSIISKLMRGLFYSA